MILNEEEVQTGLCFVLLDVFIIYDIVMQVMHILLADEKVLMIAVVLFIQYLVVVVCDFQIQYENQSFIFKNIHGKIEYLFLQFPIISFLKSFLKDSHIIFQDNQIQYQIALPIQQMHMGEGYLSILLKNNQRYAKKFRPIGFSSICS